MVGLVASVCALASPIASANPALMRTIMKSRIARWWLSCEVHPTGDLLHALTRSSILGRQMPLRCPWYPVEDGWRESSRPEQWAVGGSPTEWVCADGHFRVRGSP